MWRNGRRNGLKIALFAISVPFAAYQIQRCLLGQIARVCEFSPYLRGRAEMGLLLHKFLHKPAGTPSTPSSSALPHNNLTSGRPVFSILQQFFRSVDHRATDPTTDVGAIAHMRSGHRAARVFPIA